MNRFNVPLQAVHSGKAFEASLTLVELLVLRQNVSVQFAQAIKIFGTNFALLKLNLFVNNLGPML
jgi:hypothetical protein